MYLPSEASRVIPRERGNYQIEDHNSIIVFHDSIITHDGETQVSLCYVCMCISTKRREREREDVCVCYI